MDDSKINEFKELQPGTGLCGGKYIIEKKIGEGGFGITYKAMQSGLERLVCIKEYFPAGYCVRDTYARTIHNQGMDDSKFEKYRQAFVKEARTLAALHHPNIVEVIDIFDENNTSYMVMPFIEGRSLQSIVEQNGPLTYPEAVNYMAQIADAVGYIHEHHILHRDIKPDNVMVTAEYRAILIDFGSAREFENDKTQAQTSMLTHGYAPTEQYTNNSRKGSYTDIYAIGATLYYILTGKVPMEAAARITEHMPEPKELNPSLPDEANRTIMKAMQLKSQDRHQTVQEFMDDLRNIKPSQQVDSDLSEPPSPQDEQQGNNGSDKSDKKETAAQPERTKAAGDAGKAPRSKGLLWGIIGGVVVVGAVVAYLLLSGGGTSAAKSNQDRYKSFVSQCNRLIANGNASEYQSLIDAKKLLDSVRTLEMAYSAEMPEVYNRVGDLEGALLPKLVDAAAEWERQGDQLIQDLEDYVGAAEAYRLSNTLKSDINIENKYKQALKMAAGNQ